MTSQMPERVTTLAAVVLALSTAVVTMFAEWLTVSISMPFGVLMVLVILIMIPTGDLIRLWALFIEDKADHYETDKEPPDAPPLLDDEQ